MSQEAFKQKAKKAIGVFNSIFDKDWVINEKDNLIKENKAFKIFILDDQIQFFSNYVLNESCNDILIELVSTLYRYVNGCDYEKSIIFAKCFLNKYLEIEFNDFDFELNKEIFQSLPDSFKRKNVTTLKNGMSLIQRRFIESSPFKIVKTNDFDE